MLWFWDHQKASFWSKMSVLWIGISIPWERKEISIFHHQLMMKKSSDFPRDEKNPHLQSFSLHYRVTPIKLSTEQNYFPSPLLTKAQKMLLHLLPLDLRQPALCSKASEVQNRNPSESSIVFCTALPAHLTMLPVEQMPPVGDEGICNSANVKPAR